MSDTVQKAVVAAVVGGLLGWVGNALTLGGRVSAIEQTLVRIEARLYATANTQPAAPAKP